MAHTKPTTWYTATPADGIIEHSRRAGTPVSLADNVGQVIDHPSPCRNKWYDESPFSYFRMVKHAGEALQDTGIHPITWPIRLWIVEPVGDTGNWDPRHYPYRLLSHQLRVVEETDAWRALGRGGREVLDVIEHQIPDCGARWAADWAADPDGMRERMKNWRLVTARHTSGMRAHARAVDTARTRHEAAGQDWTRRLAAATAQQAAADEGFDQAAIDYARLRAANLAAAAHIQDRQRDAYLLDALRGALLDNPAVKAAEESSRADAAGSRA